MILPITAYGYSVLRKKGELITKDYEGLNELIQNMFDTMYNANGVGLQHHKLEKVCDYLLQMDALCRGRTGNGPFQKSFYQSHNA